MKKLIPLALLLLLLSACGKGAAEPTVPPETPAPTPMATPTPSPEPEALQWGVNYTLEDIDKALLPTTVATDWEEGSAAVQNGVPFFLLGEVPEADISLYGFWLPNQSAVLVRKGDTFTYFPQEFAWAGGSEIPALRWSDLDGDGTEELGVIYAGSGGSQSFLSKLHVYQWADGWTDHYFSPEDYSAILDDLLTVKGTNSTLTVSHGLESASYTNGPKEGTAPTLCRDYGSMVFFRFDQGGPAVIFPLRTQAGFHSFASVAADVEYDSGNYTLRNLQLMSIGGV